MGPDFAVSGVVKRSLSDIKAGDYIASTSIRERDGKLRALEVHYPAAGSGRGAVRLDLAPDSLMTNATVAGVATAPQGQVLRVTYKGQEAEITVPPDVPVVAFVPGDMSLVKPGAASSSLAAGAPMVPSRRPVPPWKRMASSRRCKRDRSAAR